MAVHAGLGRRNIGEARSLHGGMAIAAIHAQTAGMMRVAERHGLFPSLIGACCVGRPVQLGEDPGQKGQDENGAEDRNPRECVRAAMKNLRHGLIAYPDRASDSLGFAFGNKKQLPARLPSYPNLATLSVPKGTRTAPRGSTSSPCTPRIPDLVRCGLPTRTRPHTPRPCAARRNSNLPR